jgi:hypothetical protein
MQGAESPYDLAILGAAQSGENAAVNAEFRQDITLEPIGNNTEVEGQSESGLFDFCYHVNQRQIREWRLPDSAAANRGVIADEPDLPKLLVRAIPAFFYQCRRKRLSALIDSQKVKGVRNLWLIVVS